MLIVGVSFAIVMTPEGSVLNGLVDDEGKAMIVKIGRNYIDFMPEGEDVHPNIICSWAVRLEERRFQILLWETVRRIEHTAHAFEKVTG